jgi:cell division protein FtsB
MKISKSEFDSILKGMGAVAKIEAEKATAPLAAKIASLETENSVLREAIKDLREKQTELAITPDTIRRRYESLQ